MTVASQCRTARSESEIESMEVPRNKVRLILPLAFRGESKREFDLCERAVEDDANCIPRSITGAGEIGSREK